MTDRIEITLSEAQWAILFKAATDPLALHATMQIDLRKGISVHETPSRQDLVNAAWEKIAPDFGIDPKSPRLDPARGDRAFTAVLLDRV